MIIEIIVALLVGIIAGTFTGLSPGIHINLIAALLISSLAYLSGVPPIALVVFIVSMSITHTFIDFIPSIFFGAPDEDTFLSVMPGHEFTLQGKGFDAVVYTLYGSISSLIIILIFTPVYILLLPSFYEIIKYIIPFLLIFISLYMIFRDDNFFSSFLVFILSGILGFFTFNLPVKQPLLPLLTGLFGISSIYISLDKKTKMKKQLISKLKDIKMTKTEFLKSFSAAFISAPLCSFLPGIGSGHAATIGSEIIPQERKGFLFLTGAINTIVMALSFVTVFAIAKSRSGSASAIQDILDHLTLSYLYIIILAVIISGVTSFFIGVFLSKQVIYFFNKINYQRLNLSVLIILVLITLVFSNSLGLIVLFTGSVIGIYCIQINIKRINLMAALIIPSITYYLT